MLQDGSDLMGTGLVQRLEQELTAQTAALDSLLNAGGKRGRKPSDLPLTQSQVPRMPHNTSAEFLWPACSDSSQSHACRSQPKCSISPACVCLAQLQSHACMPENTKCSIAQADLCFLTIHHGN